ncbi:hypothetical protein DBV05_g11356 [Lasiodiplodia theobromae]|uniref:Uncharacterized protein n=1 Tax=Lasiodiplodia theobromae TaxID=45133 RepID=A0A5N5CX84_9PEZI|nr:hypothetical protein DBV05_g11356 [Lasiodiplodia theobromae]
MDSKCKALDSHLQYTVGWLAPLPIERAAAEALLDEKHDQPRGFQQPENDPSSYSWGNIGQHNIVIASLRSGVYGTNTAATTASCMLSTFPSIRFGLLVGIGGGIARPDDGKDIRLGDIVVSAPGGSTGGVVNYDLMKAKADGKELKGFLNSPPPLLLHAVANLQSRHEQEPSAVPQILAEMREQNPFMFTKRNNNPGFGYQGSENDRLFEPSYIHVGGRDCKKCSSENEVVREPRDIPEEPEIHYGVIASGNTLVKDADEQQELLNRISSLSDDCMCLEMEAAGLMNDFPCLVIRGICDYADSHKNDRWQRYAAATAAAFAKELLGVVRSRKVEEMQKAKNVMKSLQNS